MKLSDTVSQVNFIGAEEEQTTEQDQESHRATEEILVDVSKSPAQDVLESDEPPVFSSDVVVSLLRRRGKMGCYSA
jgi:hypothetical protein